MVQVSLKHLCAEGCCWLGPSALAKLGAGTAHPSGEFNKANLSKELLRREKGLDCSLKSRMSTRLSCQGAGAAPGKRCERVQHQAAAVGYQAGYQVSFPFPRELPVLCGPALTRLVGAQSCSESSCRFWLPPESPPAGPAFPGPHWCFRRGSSQARVGREALFL